MDDYEDLPKTGPYLAVHRRADGTWLYRWWDEADSFVIGEPPTRTKRWNHPHGILAAVLADLSRTGHGGDPTTGDGS